MVLGGEFYQKYLSEYTSQFYFFEIYCDSDKQQEQLCHDIQRLERQLDINVFTSLSSTDNAFLSSQHVYASKDTQEKIKTRYCVNEGRFNSVFSGTTQVEFKSLEKTVGKLNENKYYLIGDEGGIYQFFYVIHEGYETSYIHKGDGGSANCFIVSVWIVFGLFLLLLTWLDIQFQKKECFVMISLGKSRGQLILKNIFTDTLSIAVIYSVLFTVLSRYTYLFYKQSQIIAILISVIVINAALYFTILSIDFKEVLYGANVNEVIISNCYLIKAIMMIVTVAVLSVNIILISSNAQLLTQYEKLDKFADYYFIEVNMYPEKSLNTDRIIDSEIIKGQIFYELYIQDKATISVNEAVVDDFSILLINNNTFNFFNKTELTGKDFDKDICIFIPSNCDIKEKVVDFSLEYVTQIFNLPNNPTYETVTYGKNGKALFLRSGERVKIPLGFGIAENQVVIYINSSRIINTMTENNSATPHVAGIFKDIMFRVSQKELTEIEEKYNLKNSSEFYFEYELVSQRFNKYKEPLTRIILLNTVISVFMLILEITLITSIVRFEYKVHAMEHAVKKILGYSIYRRNKILFLLSGYAAAIGIMTVIIGSLMYQYSKWYIVALTGISLFLFESLAIIISIHSFEKTAVPKILKGGSL